MRTLILRVLFVALLPLGLVAAPAAQAKPDVPHTCELVRNTHCHCIDPRTTIDCMIID